MSERTNNPSLEDYFYQEAKEKCYEIEIKGLKEYEKEKKRLVEKDRETVKDDFDKKLRQREAESKIARSTRINRSRLEKMEARNQVLLRIVEEAERAVAKRIETDPQFNRKLLKSLIMQAIVKMLEPAVLVRCLKRDVEICRSLINEIQNEYKEYIRKELDIEKTIDVAVDTENFLEQRSVQGESKRITKTDEMKKCVGGVIVLNGDLTIVCKNTVDARLELCYQESLPDLRGLLFPEHR